MLLLHKNHNVVKYFSNDETQIVITKDSIYYTAWYESGLHIFIGGQNLTPIDAIKSLKENLYRMINFKYYNIGDTISLNKCKWNKIKNDWELDVNSFVITSIDDYSNEPSLKSIKGLTYTLQQNTLEIRVGFLDIRGY